MCKKGFGQSLTAEELKELLRNNDPVVINQIWRSAEKLRGTRPYWTRRARELENVVLNIGAPHLFFTFSAADLQWHDLRKHMPGFEGLSELSEPERLRKSAANLNDNPHVAAAYLVKRFKAFFQHVLKKVFCIKDHWYRFEWQERGSGHIHGFLWLERAPPPRSRTPEERDLVAAYWADWVTAMNPYRTMAHGTNPASIPFRERSNTKLHLTKYLNWYQRHSIYTPAYYLRKVKGSEEHHYRFHFPQTFKDVAEVSCEQNIHHYKFLPVRNDMLMNNHIPTITLGWNTNTDMSPCTNIHNILRYCDGTADHVAQFSPLWPEPTGLALHQRITNPFSSFFQVFNTACVQSVHHVLYNQLLPPS